MEKHHQKIIRFYRQARRMPSYSELAEILGFKSKNAAYKIVKKMIALGWIERDSCGKIIPRKIFGETRILGTIEAGFPSPAEEELVDTITLDEYLIKNKEATYMLKVSGDSMIDAGIRQGDIVLVERNKNPGSGDIVIAEVDGEWTMKYFKKVKNRIWLVAANKKYPPIIPSNELKIAAVVIAVIRKYKN